MRNLILLPLIAVASIGMYSTAAVAANDGNDAAQPRQVNLVYTVKVDQSTSEASRIDIWLPLPLNIRSAQRTSQPVIETSLRYEFVYDKYGSRSLHLFSELPIKGPISAIVRSTVTRTPYTAASNPPNSGLAIPPEYQKALPETNNDIFLGAKERLAASAAKMNDQQKAMLVFRQVLAKNEPEGILTKTDSSVVATERVCSEEEILTVAYSRSIGFPARFVFGLRLPESLSESTGNATSACWAEIMVPGEGFAPMDFESRLTPALIAKNLYGALDQNRIEYGTSPDPVFRGSGSPAAGFVEPYGLRNGNVPITINSLVTFENISLPSSYNSDNNSWSSRLERALDQIQWTSVLSFGGVLAGILALFGLFSTIISKASELDIGFVKRPIERWKARDQRSKWQRTREQISLEQSSQAKQKILLSSRLADLETAYRGYAREYRWSGIAAWLFSISQYVVGGLIAASPALQSHPAIISFLGFLVLLTSLLQRIYDPKSAAVVAKQKAHSFGDLLEEMNENSAELNPDSSALDYRALSTLIRTRMKDIERTESIDLPRTVLDGTKEPSSQSKTSSDRVDSHQEGPKEESLVQR